MLLPSPLYLPAPFPPSLRLPFSIPMTSPTLPMLLQKVITPLLAPSFPLAWCSSNLSPLPLETIHHILVRRTSLSQGHSPYACQISSQDSSRNPKAKKMIGSTGDEDLLTSSPSRSLLIQDYSLKNTFSNTPLVCLKRWAFLPLFLVEDFHSLTARKFRLS